MNRLTHSRAVLAIAAVGMAIPLGEALVHGEPFTLFLAAAIVGFFAGCARSRVAGAAALGIVFAVTAVCELIDSTNAWVPEVMLPVALYATGLVLRERDAVARRLAAQAAELEAERETYAQLSVRYERARIATELHDVVAHAISVMVVQASAGQRLAVANPDAARATFAVIGEAARQAEADLDRLAGLLSQDSAAGDADLMLMQELVDRAAGSGLPVTLRLEGHAGEVRGAVAHAAFRVVQEGLTNALRYAPGAPVRVTVSARPARVDVEVANDAVGDRVALGLGSGHGLTGLRERVAACGGTFAAGPDSAGGWAVKASLPRGAVTAG